MLGDLATPAGKHWLACQPGLDAPGSYANRGGSCPVRGWRLRSLAGTTDLLMSDSNSTAIVPARPSSGYSQAKFLQHQQPAADSVKIGESQSEDLQGRPTREYQTGPAAHCYQGSQV